MNWKIVKETYECPTGFAIVSTDGKFDSCHFTRDAAVRRVEMLYKMRGVSESN
jgi:hypothetical protein